MDNYLEHPLISVVMPAFNVENYVEEAVNSILNQTYSNFEFIIIDDGSTDRTPEILKHFSDSRITVIFNGKNEGNYPARNKGCRLAKGDYIAVMDADDIAFPDRLLLQMNFLDKHSDVLALGTAYRLSENDVTVVEATEWEEIRYVFIKTFCMLHPTMMFRRNALEKVGFYRENSRYAEDYDLTLRLARNGRIVNIPDVLLMRRIHPEQISSAFKLEQSAFASKIQLRYQHEMGIFYPPSNKEFFLSQLAAYIRSIISYVKVSGLYYGRLGLILFFYHYAAYSGNHEYKDLADRMLENIIENLYINIPIEVDSGLCGLGFLLGYLMSVKFVEGDLDDVLSDLDKQIVAKTDFETNDWSFDSGIVGVIYYVVYRLNSGTSLCETVFDLQYRTNLLKVVEKIESHLDWSCPFPSLLSQCKAGLEGVPVQVDWSILWRNAIYALPKSPSLGRWNYGLYNGCAGWGISFMLNLDI